MDNKMTLEEIDRLIDAPQVITKEQEEQANIHLKELFERMDEILGRAEGIIK